LDHGVQELSSERTGLTP